MVELAGYRPDSISRNLDGRSILPYLEDSAVSLSSKEVFLYANPGWPPTDKPWSPAGVKDEYRPWKHSDGRVLDLQNQVVGFRSENYKLLLNPGPTDQTIKPNPGGYVLIDIKSDPWENENISQENPELLAEMQLRLRIWHASVFFDEHAFEMPVFRIGAEANGTSEVLAYAPQEISPNVRNASSYITRFSQADDFASYRVNVLQEGTYHIMISYELAGSRPARMAFDLSGTQREIRFRPGRKSLEIRDVFLSEGIQNWRLTTLEGSSRLRLYEYICDFQAP
jgi:hypothetical protein